MDRSIKAKERYAQAGLIASYFPGMTANDVIKYFYQELKFRGWWEEAGQGLHLKELAASLGYQRWLEDARRQEEYERRQIVPNREREAEKKEKPTTNSGRIKIAMWYIEMVGGPDIARRMLEKAIYVLNEDIIDDSQNTTDSS